MCRKSSAAPIYTTHKIELRQESDNFEELFVAHHKYMLPTSARVLYDNTEEQVLIAETEQIFGF